MNKNTVITPIYRFYDNRPYRNIVNIDNTLKDINKEYDNKISELFNITDIDEIKLYSTINKIPLGICTINGNNLIHNTILNNDNLKSEFNKLNIIKFLVQNEVNPDQPNQENKTPLHLACAQQYSSIVKYLLDIGVNPNYKDDNGFTSFHYLLSGKIEPEKNIEIKDFYISDKKIDKNQNDKIINIKLAIWEQLKNEIFFKTLEHSIIESVKTEQKILEEFPSIISDNIPDRTNQILQKNFELEKKVANKWGYFPNLDNLVIHNKEQDSWYPDPNNKLAILKDSDIKNDIKNKLKFNINNSVKLINDYFIKDKEIIPNIDLNISDIEFMNEFIRNVPLVPIGVNAIQRLDGDINNFKVWDELNNKNKHHLALDFADNIIDTENMTFIGGSREIVVNNELKDFLIQLFLDLRNKNQKILFLLLIDKIYDEYNNNKATTIFDNIMTVDIDINILSNNDLENYILNNNLIEDGLKKFIKKSYHKIINKKINAGKEIYNDYCRYKCSLSPDNLTAEIHILFFRLITSLLYDTTIDFALKIDCFFMLQDERNLLIKWKKWINFLFDENDIVNVIVQQSFPDIFNTITIDLFNKTTYSKIIINKYVSMENKPPLIYIINSLNFFNKEINLLYLFNNNPIGANQKIKNSPITIKNSLYLLDYNDNIPFQNNKINESYCLGLYYKGVLPNIKFDSPYSLYTFDKKKITFFFSHDWQFIPSHCTYGYPNDNILNEGNIPFPFNYLYTPSYYIPNVNNWEYSDYDKNKYFKYDVNSVKYRPPYIKSVESVLIKNINLYYQEQYKIAIELVSLINSILNKGEGLRQLDKIYYKYHFNIIKFNKLQNLLLNELGQKVELFNINNLIDKLNLINAYFFIYYYLFSNNNNFKLPKFIYYKLNTDKFLLFNNKKKNNALPYDNIEETTVDDIDTYINNDKNNIIYKNELIDFFEYDIYDKTIVKDYFIYNKEKVLPPSIDVILSEFYKYIKIKFIKEKLNLIDIDIIKNKYIKMENEQYYFKIVEFIDEIIKNIAETYVKNAIISIKPELTLIIKNQDFNINLNKSIIKIKNTDTNLLNLYKISEPIINNNNKFYLYSNEYTNTNLIKHRNTLIIEDIIIEKLIEKHANPYLLDNNFKSCINPLLKLYYSNSIKEFKKLDVDFVNFKSPDKPSEFIKKEYINHINKIKNNNFIDSIDNFISIQYKEIEQILLSNEKFGNNILINLKESFNIAFYLINEYITDYLLRFDDDYKKEDLNNLLNLIGYDINNIKNDNYLNECSDKLSIYKNEDTFIYNYMLELKNIELIELNKRKTRLEIEITEYTSLGLNTNIINDKIRNINLEILSINIDILNFTTNINRNKNQIIKVASNKTKIIETYNNIFINNNKYQTYLELWKQLFNNNSLLTNSWNLSILKVLFITDDILKSDDINKLKIFNVYYKHISKLAKTYFNTIKLTDENKILSFIYDVLDHLTKAIICSGIEQILYKVLFNHFLKENPNETEYNNIINKISYILNFDQYFENNYINLNTILYNEIVSKLIKNSVEIFKNYDEKQSFEPQTIKEILINYFNLLIIRGIETDSNLMLILTRDVASYFDTFVQKTINNWYVIIENTLRFTINQYRLNDMLITLIEP